MPANDAPLKDPQSMQRDAFMEGVRWYTSLNGFEVPFSMQGAARGYYPDPITVPFGLAEDILDNWSGPVREKASYVDVRRFQESLTQFLPQLLALKDTTR